MNYILMRRNENGATLLSQHASQAEADAARDVLTLADAVAWNATRDANYTAGAASNAAKIPTDFNGQYDIQAL